MNYKKTAESAMEKYATMPEEPSELYKRNYLKIPIKEMPANFSKAEAYAKGSAAENAFEKLGIKFDVVSNGFSFASNSSNVKVYEVYKNADLPEVYGENTYDKYMAFVQAYTTQIIVVEAKEKEKVELSMLFDCTNYLNVQVIVDAKKDSHVSLHEWFASGKSGEVSGSINSVIARNGANVNIDIFHNEADAKVLNFCSGRAEEQASINVNSMFAGGAIARSNCRLEAEGNNSKVDLSELIIASETQGFDIESFVSNSGKNSRSGIDSRAIAMDDAVCIMKGRAKMEQGSSDSESVISERGLIMGSNARVETIPSMEVLENAVKASHSSAVSPLSTASIEYMMSRGIDEEEAKAMLAIGTVYKSIARFNNKFIDIIYSIVRHRLNGSDIGKLPEALDLGIATLEKLGR